MQDARGCTPATRRGIAICVLRRIVYTTAWWLPYYFLSRAGPYLSLRGRTRYAFRHAHALKRAQRSRRIPFASTITQYVVINGISIVGQDLIGAASLPSCGNYRGRCSIFHVATAIDSGNPNRITPDATLRSVFSMATCLFFRCFVLRSSLRQWSNICCSGVMTIHWYDVSTVWIIPRVTSGLCVSHIHIGVVERRNVGPSYTRELAICSKV